MSDDLTSGNTNIALAQGLVNFTGVLEGLAPRPASRRVNARMRPISRDPVRDDGEQTDGDGMDDPWEASDDSDADADGGPTEDDPDEDEDDDCAPPPAIPPVQDFHPAPGGSLVAVDAGRIGLAETAEGLIVAIRAAIVIENPTEEGRKTRVFLMRSGPLFLPWAHQLEILHAIGMALGDAGFYVTLDTSDPEDPHPLTVKRGTERPDLYRHRIMVLFERLAQQIAVGLAPKDAIFLPDGALTLRSRDTPPRFLKGLVRQASGKGLSVVAISKQSDLLVGCDPESVKAIPFWLDDAPHKIGYRLLSPLLDTAPAQRGERQRPPRAPRILGRCYAARFSPLGETYRVDVKPARGDSDAETMDRFRASAMIVSGYPSIMAQAHAHCYFSSADVLALQVQAAAMFGLHPQPGLTSTGAYAPFQGSFK